MIIQKRNLCFDVNTTSGTTSKVTLYLNLVYFCGKVSLFSLKQTVVAVLELRGDLRDPADAEAELCAADQPEPGPLLPHLDCQEDEGVDRGDSETHHRGAR